VTHAVRVDPAVINGRRVGYVVVCSCGYRSEVWSNWPDAVDDADDHERS